MKKFEKIFFSMIAMIMMVAVGSVFTSCSNDDDDFPVTAQETQLDQALGQDSVAPMTRSMSYSIAIAQTLKNRYLHKPYSSKSQTAAYVTAYNMINNASRTISEIGSEETLQTLAGLGWSNGGIFTSTSTETAGADYAKYSMFNTIKYYIQYYHTPVVVYGTGYTGDRGGLIVCAIDSNASYNSTNANIRYTDLKLADETNSSYTDRFSANVQEMSAKDFMDGMVTSNRILNAIVWTNYY